MKIGLYGVSRCGKNYLVDKVVKRAPALKFMPGSATLKELSAKIFKADFRSLQTEQQMLLRLEFTKEVIKEENGGLHIIVDGHYSFPQKDSDAYNVVFTEADKKLYDIFIYMNTPSDRIVENANLGEAGRENTLYNAAAIEKWKAYEVAALRKVCRELGKELIVFDGDVECCCDFLCDLVANPQYLLSSDIVKNILADNNAALSEYNTVLLIDCDRTITVGDTTYDFCDAANVDKNMLKTIYYGEYYSVYQFYRAHRLYEAITPSSLFHRACAYAAEKAQLNDTLLADIRVHKNDVCVIAITSGVVNIWSNILQRVGIQHILIGKGMLGTEGYFVSTTTKYMLANMLQKMGKRVVAVGDSMIDIQMLETADKGFVVTGEKTNLGVKRYFDTHASDTKIKQLAYNPLKYDKLNEAISIWEE